VQYRTRIDPLPEEFTGCLTANVGVQTAVPATAHFLPLWKEIPAITRLSAIEVAFITNRPFCGLSAAVQACATHLQIEGFNQGFETP
jgi:hypothetical protein